MLNEVFSRLHLKGEPVTTHPAASDDEIDELWRDKQKVDQELLVTDTTQKDIKDRAALKQYLDHCCTRQHYFFEIKKCGDQQCATCGPPCHQTSSLSCDTSQTLWFNLTTRTTTDCTQTAWVSTLLRLTAHR